MPPFSSLQEEVVYRISQFTLGRQILFCPENFGESREPADLVWISGRCAILMYMTKSNKSCEKKIAHNLGQMQGWLKLWKNGQILRGKVGGRLLEIKFDDIDYIIGLSVIDGGEVWCEYHQGRVENLKSYKLAACATITGKILRELAVLGCGPRDIVAHLVNLKDSARRFAEVEMLQGIRLQAEAENSAILHGFSSLQRPHEFREHPSRETNSFFSALKTGEGVKSAGLAEEDLGQLLSEMTLADKLWFMHASEMLESNLAGPGQYGPLCLMSMRRSGPYRFQYAAAVSMKEINAQFAKLAHEEPGLTMAVTFDLGLNFPFRTMLVKSHSGTSLLARDLMSLCVDRGERT